MTQRHDKLAIEAYARQYGKLGREVWSEVALWLLCYQKHTLIDFLEATHTALYPPINWVEDCLCCLVRHYNLMETNHSHGWSQLLVQLFFKLVDRDTNEQYMFNSDFFRPLLAHCTALQVNELYRMIKTGKVKVLHHTLLHFADHFGKHDRIEQSLDALLEAKAAGADINSVPYRSCCSTLLRASSQHPGGLRICLRLIESLVSVGVKLNRILCNVVMLNAVEARDLDTADAIHLSAIQQGFAPSAYTCAIRLKACKLDISNVQRLTETIEETIANGEVRQNEIVATEIMHCLALHHTQEFQEGDSGFGRWRTVAAAYMQLFDPGPLTRLGVKMPADASVNTNGTVEQRMPPTRHAIAFLLTVYLRYGSKLNEAERIYKRWRELVEAGDAPLAACATTPNVSNIFLRAITRQKSKMLQAARIVKDMQKPLPESAGVEQAEPDAYTWSIFLHGFASTGQMKLAEQVLRYMRSRSIEPNHVTWTSLVGAYAAAQDSEGMLDALRRMGQGGFAWNEWTRRNVTRLRNQQKLKELLEEQRLQQNLDFSGELKEGLVHKLLSGPDDKAAQELGSLPEMSPRLNAGAVGGFADSATELAEMPAR
ncbi:hypothetical protein LTR85_006974 [Meristemomyces frigidus]|nr:hypothetical protein LTR85_006974 [Meristemomyces frigidus]